MAPALSADSPLAPHDSLLYAPASGKLPAWLPLPWPPGFFVPGCFCCGEGARAFSCGGSDAFATVFFATTDRTQFSTDITTAVSGAALSSPRGEAAGVANPALCGYIAGGRTAAAAPVQTTDKLSFASETTAAATTANLTAGRYALAGLSERTNKAYFAGGFSTPVTVTADKLTFASDTTSAQTSANLSISRGGPRGISEGATKGYWGGGFTAPAAWTARTDKLTFATDSSAAQTSANLTVARDRYHAMSDGAVKGYFAGGQTGAGLTICDKVTFATDTTTAQTSAAIQRINGAAMADGVGAYATGGVAGGVSKSAHKFAFSTDTVSALGVGSDLSASRTGVTGLSTVGL